MIKYIMNIGSGFEEVIVLFSNFSFFEAWIKIMYVFVIYLSAQERIGK